MHAKAKSVMIFLPTSVKPKMIFANVSHLEFRLPLLAHHGSGFFVQWFLAEIKMRMRALETTAVIVITEVVV